MQPVRKANTKMLQRTKKRVTNWSSYTAPAHYPSNEPALNRNINMPLFMEHYSEEISHGIGFLGGTCFPECKIMSSANGHEVTF